MVSSSGSNSELMAQALAAYSDACTIPSLTPGCPYYRLDETGPTCAEECRGILEQMGVQRPTTTLTVLDGLVMTGVSRPIEVASATTPFDATKILLSELHEPVATASTTTLLLRLRDFAATPPASREVTDDQFFETWRELEKRRIPVEDVLRQQAASAMSSEVLRQIDHTDGVLTDEWSRLFRSCLSQQQHDHERFASWFHTRLAAWFGRLVESDLMGFLTWTVPPEALLTNVSPLASELEASWLWDRFTLTSLEDWATTSLSLEWRRAEGNSTSRCSERVLAARRIDPDDVARVALSRLAENAALISNPIRRPEERDLSTQQFVDRAVHHLSLGYPDSAAEIFTALAFMNPADGDALNNLGFCLIPTSAAQALGPLDRAAGLPMSNPTVNVANRAFVRHLLGRDSEALALLADVSPGDTTAYVWAEEDCGSFRLSFQRLDAYVTELRAHLLPLLRGEQ